MQVSGVYQQVSEKKYLQLLRKAKILKIGDSLQVAQPASRYGELQGPFGNLQWRSGDPEQVSGEFATGFWMKCQEIVWKAEINQKVAIGRFRQAVRGFGFV